MVGVRHVQHAYAYGDRIHYVNHSPGLGLGFVQLLLLLLIYCRHIGFDDEYGAAVVFKVIMLEFSVHFAAGGVREALPQDKFVISALVHNGQVIGGVAVTEVFLPVVGMEPFFQGVSAEFSEAVLCARSRQQAAEGPGQSFAQKIGFHGVLIRAQQGYEVVFLTCNNL